MRTFWMFLVVLMALALAGCAPSQPGGDLVPSEPLAAPSEGVSSTPLPEQEDTLEMTPSPSVNPSLENLIEQAMQDLAQRLTVSLTQITVIEAKAMEWPDASLGCPQPGMRYKQVPEDGALIVLQANGITYEYHSGARRLFLCQKTAKEPTPPQIDLLNLTPSGSGATDPGSPAPDNSIPPGEDQ